MSITSPPESGFTPRKEFIRDNHSPPNSFALLALSGSNFIRLYSFTPAFVARLRLFFEQQAIAIAFREDQPQNLYELSIDGKPWANPKSATTEKLLIDLVALIYQAGYTFLSSIDYGREHDDRLAMAFSRPALQCPASPSATPLLSGSSPFPSTSLQDKSRVKRVPFALSFTSATLMRVIAPPLHLTPAILQAVRGSWPRGVVSEKKVGNNCFEFKLKGYRWFQQDTFPSDSLQHILSLLTSLDTHSFSLLTSLSLTNRSRVKDMWVFTGPAPQSPQDSSSHDLSPDHLPSDPSLLESRALHRIDGPVQQPIPARATQIEHRRFATEPVTSHSHFETPHRRSTTDDKLQQPFNSTSLSSAQPHLLRKPAPRAQVPVSVVHEQDVNIAEPETERRRVDIPSTISSGIENMTGVGALGQIHELSYTSLPFENIPNIPAHASTNSPQAPYPSPHYQRHAASNSLNHERPPLRPVSERAKTPPLLSSTPPVTPQRQLKFPSQKRISTGSMESEDRQSPKVPQSLLSPGIFRDSAFSSQSNTSCEIPIKWTGAGNEDPNPPSRGRLQSQSTNTPNFPGGWQPTPIDEKQEEEAGFENKPTTITSNDAHTPIYEMRSRVESPELVRPDPFLRKSEAALVGIIASSLPPASIPRLHSLDRSPKKDLQPSGQSGGGQGWVLVNVEGPTAALPTDLGSMNPTRSRDAPSSSEHHGSANGSTAIKLPNNNEHPSASAKAIVIIDAMDSKHKKARSVSNRELAEGSSIRRFFSLNKKNSQKKILDDKTEGKHEDDSHIKTTTTIPRSNLRDRLRLIGTPEASRKEDKRRSID